MCCLKRVSLRIPTPLLSKFLLFWATPGLFLFFIFSIPSYRPIIYYIGINVYVWVVLVLLVRVFFNIYAGISFSLYFSICRVLHPCGTFIFSGLAKYVLAFCFVFTETNNFFFLNWSEKKKESSKPKKVYVLRCFFFRYFGFVQVGELNCESLKKGEPDECLDDIKIIFISIFTSFREMNTIIKKDGV